MTGITVLTPAQTYTGSLVDALDLEPITYKLMHPEPGQAVMSLADADQLVTAYRCFLKLCAWYPEESIVPSKAIDEVWHAHILDTGKYAADCEIVFGHFAHHFPYFGLRGSDDETAWHAAYDRTRELFRQHFGTDLPGRDMAGASCHVNGSSCRDGNSICVFDDSITCEKTTGSAAADGQRPRPDRATASA
jgi:hypothetical protein